MQATLFNGEELFSQQVDIYNLPDAAFSKIIIIDHLL